MHESRSLLLALYGMIIASAWLMGSVQDSLVYAVLAAVMCVAHATAVGPGGNPPLSERASRLLALLASGFVCAEATYTDGELSYSLSHFLVLMQVILLFGEHRLSRLRLMHVLAVFEVLVAAAWAREVTFVPAFAATGVAVLASLLLMEAHRARTGDGEVPDQDPGPWGMDGKEIASAIWGPVVAVFLATMLLFVVLPRVNVMRRLGRGMSGLSTGFSNDVSLRDVGRIEPSDRLALQARFHELTEGSSKPVPYRPQDMLMRGRSYPLYRWGDWHPYGRTISAAHLAGAEEQDPGFLRSESRAVYLLEEHDIPKTRIFQEVEVQDNTNTVVFALYRPIEARSIEETMPIGGLSHDLYSLRTSAASSYVVTSLHAEFPPALLRAVGTPEPVGSYSFFWHVPRPARDAVAKVASEIEKLSNPDSDYDRARATVQYLTDPSRFTYSLDLADYGAQDPVAAFLTSHRTGHCELFATSMALILRHWGIPTRLVTGYKGGTYDSAQEAYVFRDRDAHAWVEVFFNHVGWVEFDPTPSLSGSQYGTGTDMTLLEKIRYGTEKTFNTVSLFWHRRVVAYSAQDQRRALAGIGKAAQQAARRVTSVARHIWPGMPQLRFLHVFVAALGLTALVLLSFAADRRFNIRLELRKPPADNSPALRLYREMVSIIEKKGLTKPASLTPREFARAADQRIAALQGDYEDARSALAEITEVYYRSRCGGETIAQEALQDARRGLAQISKMDRIPQDIDSKCN